ncbi:hypothetical protein SDC9_139860 [bioreactor metagenome]|uniref:Phosphoglycolate phosphatase n=1 Tax=bioreactor metagenome TaxID=1076179 RepID=A0A645DTA5_9ZZZZ|nr:HAD hydrolase-like protein [Oscillospiraceae bacterium]
MIKAILFDFDGVLTTDATGSTSICNYISMYTGISLEAFKSEYYKYNNDLLYGKITHVDIWQKLCDNLNYNISMDILNDSFINTPIDKQMLFLAETLKIKGYKIGMITDNKADRINCIVKHLNWSKVFDVITVSANIGSGKNCEEIFIQTIESLNLLPNECVFIDNQEKNLIIPKQMGIMTIYFDHIKRDYENLINELSKIGCIL